METETQIENESCEDHQVPQTSSLPIDSSIDDDDEDELFASASILEIIRNSKSEGATAIRKDMDITLSRLEYLGGEHSNIIFTALEKQNKELESVFEEIARMEGILAKEGVKVSRLMASGDKILENLQKAADKFGPIGEMAIAIEGAVDKGQFFCDYFNRGEFLSDSERVSVGKLALPMYNQYRKIFQEVSRRSTACIKELGRKIRESRTD